MYYIGLDVHKKSISYCVKDASGQIHAEGAIPATRFDLGRWMKTLPQPWTAAMEATLFTGWIYDHLLPHAAALKVAHPLMLRAIAAAKKKNDQIDANKIADGLRCDFLPECYMASTEIRERRRTLRYRNLLVRQAVQLKNKISGLLMEAGVSYNKRSAASAEDGKCSGAVARARSAPGRTSGATYDHSSGRPDYGADLGARNWGCEAFLVDKKGYQLLRAVRRGEQFGKHDQAHPSSQAAQQATGRGRKETRTERPSLWHASLWPTWSPWIDAKKNF
jgi:hypothetical protein